MKTLLVASDFSDISNNATAYALEAARQTGAKVVLFHLYRLSVHASNARLSPATIEDSMDRNKAELEMKVKELAEQYGVEVVGEWVAGEFQSLLQQAIEDHQVDLVVMGMATKSIEQDLLGNTTTAAINRLKFPILAIPADAKFEGIHRILYACDMVRGVHANILEQVRKVATSFDAQVDVFHVSNRLEAIGEKERLAQAAAKNFGDGLDGITYSYKNVASNAVVQEIENEVKDTGADLLVMVPYEYGFWGSLIHKSKTRAMASGSSIPLLSIPI